VHIDIHTSQRNSCPFLEQNQPIQEYSASSSLVVYYKEEGEKRARGGGEGEGEGRGVRERKEKEKDSERARETAREREKERNGGRERRSECVREREYERRRVVKDGVEEKTRDTARYDVSTFSIAV